MRLVAHAAEGTHRSADQLHAARTGSSTSIIYDGLVAFKKANGPEGFKIVPDLAEAVPTPTDGGKTYVFKLRKGIKFSERQATSTSTTWSPPSSASSRYRARPRARSSTASSAPTPASTTPDDLHPRWRRRRRPRRRYGDDQSDAPGFGVPLQARPCRMRSILPADAPMQDVGTTPIAGHRRLHDRELRSQHRDEAGPQSALQGMERRRAAGRLPGRDRLRFRPDRGSRRSRRCRTARPTGCSIRRRPTGWPRSAPSTQSRCIITPLTALWYAPMNTQPRARSTISKARQAVNYAIDRKALVNLFGGPVLASPVCQVLPPGFPGHEDYCRLYQGSGRQVVGARPGQGQAAGARNPAPSGQKVTIIVQDIDGRPERRRLPAERAQRSGLQGQRQGDLGQHPVHLHPEHQQQGADQRHAVVPGLPCGVRLPQRAVRLRVVPSRAPTARSTSPASATRTIDARWSEAMALAVTDWTGPTSSGRGSTRASRTGAGRRPSVHAEAPRLRLQRASAISSSTASSTG